MDVGWPIASAVGEPNRCDRDNSLKQFPIQYAVSFALRDIIYSEKSRSLKPAPRNTETENALA
jgi:hypothetical protein